MSTLEVAKCGFLSSEVAVRKRHQTSREEVAVHAHCLFGNELGNKLFQAGDNTDMLLGNATDTTAEIAAKLKDLI